MAKEAKQLDELFHNTLKDIYFAEKKILATLPKMEKAAQSSELKKAFAKHRTETDQQEEKDTSRTVRALRDSALRAHRRTYGLRGAQLHLFAQWGSRRLGRRRSRAGMARCRRGAGLPADWRYQHPGRSGVVG